MIISENTKRYQKYVQVMDIVWSVVILFSLAHFSWLVVVLGIISVGANHLFLFVMQNNDYRNDRYIRQQMGIMGIDQVRVAIAKEVSEQELIVEDKPNDAFARFKLHRLETTLVMASEIAREMREAERNAQPTPIQQP